VLTGRDPAPPLAGAALHGPASGCEADGFFFAGGADGRVHLLYAGPDAGAAPPPPFVLIGHAVSLTPY